MPFNANTYYANKYRRRAWEELAEARAIKRRMAEGRAFVTDHPHRVSHFVILARCAMRLHINYKKS